MTIARLPFSPRSMWGLYLCREQREAHQDVVEIAERVGINRRERRPHARRGDHATQVVDVLAQREVDARLVLEADDRQVFVEHLGGAVAIARRELAKNLDEDLRECKPGHGPDGAVPQLLEEHHAAQAAEDLHLARESADRSEEHTSELQSVKSRMPSSA